MMWSLIQHPGSCGKLEYHLLFSTKGGEGPVSLDNWGMKGLEKDGAGDKAEGCLERISETKTPYLLLPHGNLGSLFLRK